VNWSIVVFPAPGPNFNIEKLKGQDFKILAQPIIEHSENAVGLVKWADGV
jgi:hypothetical protein